MPSTLGGGRGGRRRAAGALGGVSAGLGDLVRLGSSAGGLMATGDGRQPAGEGIEGGVGGDKESSPAAPCAKGLLAVIDGLLIPCAVPARPRPGMSADGLDGGSGGGGA